VSDEERKLKEKKPKRVLSKMLFAMFVFLTLLSIFLFWATRNMAASEDSGYGWIFASAIIALCLAILFGLISFVQFLRRKTVAGGLFLTTAGSTAVFLGASQLIGRLLPPFMAAGVAMGDDPATTGGSFGIMVLLAQVGLFALWFGFLLFTIKAYVRPVGRINKYLQKIKDGEEIGRVRIGKSKQYREIAQTIRELSDKMENSTQSLTLPASIDSGPEV